MRLLHYTLRLVFVSACGISYGQPLQSTMTQAGYTGLAITPNAKVIPWGAAATAYDSQLPGVSANPAGRNFVVGFGLLPNFEISDRLATTNLNSNCFVENCGIRDLSASGKISIPLDSDRRFSLAFGGTDIGGAAANFRTYYGVGTYTNGNVEASAGLAKRAQGDPSRPRSPLSGPFAAAAWQPFGPLRLQVEYTDKNAWAGLRVLVPQRWMPEGWSAYVGTNHRLNSNPYTNRHWFSAGLTIPLYKVPELPRTGGHSSAEGTFESHGAPLPGSVQPNTNSASSAWVAPPPESPASAGKPPSDEQLAAAATALQDRGLDSIWVGRDAEGTIVARADNGSYRRNTVDALGAGLGALANALADGPWNYRFILTQNDVPLVAASGNVNCLRLWVRGQDPACIPLQLATPGTADLNRFQERTQWSIRNQQPASHTLRVAITPVLRTHIGTEFGALDYSGGINVGLQLPVWKGGRVEFRRDVPVTNTSDFEQGGIFGIERMRSETERFALVQTVPLSIGRVAANSPTIPSQPSSVTFQGMVGRVAGQFDGVHGALRWEPGDGEHRLTAEAGYFRNAQFGMDRLAASVRKATPVLVHYRFNFSATRSYVEAAAGQFMYNDRGFEFGLRQWFNDASLRTYYRRTQFPAQRARQFIGIELSFPIGPRHDARPIPHLQIGGGRFALGDETMIREPVNAVTSGFGVMPPTPSLEETFNFDRAGLAYFESNLRRIRDAAQARQQ